MPVAEPAASFMMLAFSCFDEVSFKWRPTIMLVKMPASRAVYAIFSFVRRHMKANPNSGSLKNDATS
jgi:hypothetical protein